MRLLPVLLLVVGCSPLIVVSEATPVAEECAEFWAIEAKPLYLGDDLTPSSVSAPDQITTVKATQDSLLITNKRGQTFSLDVLINKPLMEVLWSADSQRFAFNLSDGGIVGSWDVKVYSLDNLGTPTALTIMDEVKLLSKALPQCEEVEEANIGISAWLAEGRELLVVAEVPPHSSCRNMGALEGFRVSAKTGKIIERLPEKLLRQNWGVVLGCRFSK